MLPSKNFPFIVSVAMVPLTELVTRDFEEVVINTNVHMPSMFSFRIRSSGVTGVSPETLFKYIDPPSPFVIGAPVSIRAIQAEEALIPPDIPLPLLTGEITALEAEFDGQGGATLIVRGYDKSHRLHRGKKTKTYQMMPDNLIVQQVTATAGVLTTALPTTSPPREYVLQNNQTDYDFLQEIARRNGYEMVVNLLGVLMFKPKGTPLPGPPGPLLTWGKQLTSFQPRMSAADQDSAVLVQAWDSKLKMPIAGVFPAPPVSISGGLASKAQMLASRSMFGISKDVVSDQPLALMPEATNIAKARAMDISSLFMQADGECRGNPRVQAASIITLLGLGATYSGPYLVGSATHHWSPAAGYTTGFSITGAQPDTVGDLLNGGKSNEGSRTYGVVVGKVTNNMDPFQLGRVKVQLPYLGALPPVESAWCRLAAPMAGGPLKSGFYAIPEINDEVLIAFDHGDVNFPYIVGALWNAQDMPPKPSAQVVIGGKVTKRIIRSRSGHEVTLDDTPGMEKISIVDKTMMNKFEIDSIKQSLTISVIGDVNIECLNFKVKSKVNIEMDALAMAKLTSKASTELGGGAAMVKIDGKIVDVNSGALKVI